MTPEVRKQLLAQDEAMRGRMAPWAKKALDLIASKLSDAAAHASKAITETAKSAPDGRPTLRVIRRNPSFQAAWARLSDLQNALAGESIQSTSGLIRDARAAFYADSFEMWKSSIDPGAWVSLDAQPTAKGIANAKAQTIHGAELRDEIGQAIDIAVNNLTRAVNTAANRYSGPARADWIKLWRDQTERQIGRVVLGAISDSDQRCHTLACLDLLKPSLLGKTDLSQSSHSA